ncbi:class I SAM-dependent methyltransferase [Longimicrobium sp.]|jgi:SAM-dependent methyltransferase|uniref:class I SAM-dependent methyltransferase n=1 Tax=Longimicrobium sp. TaxID=2029185 RepID=UPI002EDB7610
MADLPVTADAPALKGEVREFWDRASCGEVYARGGTLREQYDNHAGARYRLEPYIHPFARFAEGRGRDVLEIGVGMGADHLEWAKAGPASLSGIDLTPRAIEHAATRLALHGFRSRLEVADAECLPFADGSFDLVYSWGVLHHSPDTARAVREVWRVLRPGGRARVMIYHKHSLVGYMLWARYALLAGNARRTLDQVYAAHLESPGTKAYTVGEARNLFRDFARVEARSCLAFGDLLQGEVGQGHPGALLSVAKLLWPRWLLSRVAKRLGLMILIEAEK